jgi:hypothetical protein
MGSGLATAVHCSDRPTDHTLTHRPPSGPDRRPPWKSRAHRPLHPADLPSQHTKINYARPQPHAVHPGLAVDVERFWFRAVMWDDAAASASFEQLKPSRVSRDPPGVAIP